MGGKERYSGITELQAELRIRRAALVAEISSIDQMLASLHIPEPKTSFEPSTDLQEVPDVYDTKGYVDRLIARRDKPPARNFLAQLNREDPPMKDRLDK